MNKRIGARILGFMLSVMMAASLMTTVSAQKSNGSLADVENAMRIAREASADTDELAGTTTNALEKAKTEADKDPASDAAVSAAKIAVYEATLLKHSANTGVTTWQTALTKAREYGVQNYITDCSMGLTAAQQKLINANLMLVDAEIIAAKVALAKAKSDAMTALATHRNGKADADYDADGVAALNAAKNAGDNAIEGAPTTDAVATALQNAKAAIDAVQTKAQKKAEEEAKAATKKKKTASKGVKVGGQYVVAKNKYKVTALPGATWDGEVMLVQAKNARNVKVPKTVRLKDGKLYEVTRVGKRAFRAKKIRNVTLGANVEKINARAFQKSKAKTVIVKSKYLTKAKVKGSLKGSKVKTIKVKVGSKKTNKKYVKKYKKIFTKKNAGRKVKVRR